MKLPQGNDLGLTSSFLDHLPHFVQHKYSPTTCTVVTQISNNHTCVTFHIQKGVISSLEVYLDFGKVIFTLIFDIHCKMQLPWILNLSAENV